MAPQPSGYVELHLFIHSLIYSTISCSVYPGSAICLEIQRTAASLQSRRGRQTWSPTSPAGVHNCQMGSEKSTILWKQVTEGTCLSCKWSGKVSWRKWPSSCNLEKEQKLKETGGERGERAGVSMYVDELSCPHTPPKVSIAPRCRHPSVILGFKDTCFVSQAKMQASKGICSSVGERPSNPNTEEKLRCWEGLQCQPPCGIWESDFDHRELLL